MDSRLAKLSPKTFVPGTASTVMLMLMSSMKLLVKTWAAATQAASAAAASAPKFVSKFAVNVGVMTRRVSSQRRYSGDWAGLGRPTPVAKPCLGRASGPAAPGTPEGSTGRGRTTPVAEPSVWRSALVGRATPVAKPTF